MNAVHQELAITAAEAGQFTIDMHTSEVRIPTTNLEQTVDQSGLQNVSIGGSSIYSPSSVSLIQACTLVRVEHLAFDPVGESLLNKPIEAWPHSSTPAVRSHI